MKFEIEKFEIKNKEIFVYLEFTEKPYEVTLYVNISKFEDWLSSNDRLKMSYSYSGNYGEEVKVYHNIEKEDYIKSVDSSNIELDLIDYIKEFYIKDISDILTERNILSRIGKITKVEKVERRIKKESY